MAEEQMWRDDLGWIKVKARDPVEEESVGYNRYILRILHVETEEGRGFMPSVSICDVKLADGRVHLGLGQLEYGQAFIEGMAMFHKYVKEACDTLCRNVSLRVEMAKEMAGGK